MNYSLVIFGQCIIVNVWQVITANNWAVCEMKTLKSEIRVHAQDVKRTIIGAFSIRNMS